MYPVDIAVRDFEPADQASARRIIQLGMAERWAESYDPEHNPDTNDLAAHYQADGGRLLVATGPTDSVVGVVALKRDADGVGRIVRLAVDPDHRRMGIARALVSEAVERARSQQYHAVIVSTDTPWTDAVALYESAGFSVAQVEPDETTLWLDLRWTSEVVTTERLELTAPRLTDNAFIVELLTDPATRTYLGGPASFAVTEWVKAHSLAPQWGTFVVWLRDQPQRIGMIELEDWRGELELSCHLLPEFWGMGYGRESVVAGLSWAWDETEAESIIAVTQHDNRAAIHTLQKAGFRPEKTFEEAGTTQLQQRVARPADRPSNASFSAPSDG